MHSQLRLSYKSPLLGESVMKRKAVIAGLIGGFIIIFVLMIGYIMRMFGGAETSTNFNFDPSDVKYYQDKNRPEICFGAVGSTPYNINPIDRQVELSAFYVPCDKIKEFQNTNIK